MGRYSFQSRPSQAPKKHLNPLSALDDVNDDISERAERADMAKSKPQKNAPTTGKGTTRRTTGRLIAKLVRRQRDTETILQGLWPYLKSGQAINIKDHKNVYVSPKRVWRHDDEGAVELVFEMNAQRSESTADATELIKAYPKRRIASASNGGKSNVARASFSYSFTKGTKREIAQFEAEARNLYAMAEQAQSLAAIRLQRSAF